MDEFQSALTRLTYNSPAVHGGFARFTGVGQTTIDLFVDHGGNFQISGTGFTLTGQVTLGAQTFNGTLLTGTITAFGADAAGPPTREFDGLFAVTGGQLTQNNGSFRVGESPGFILFAENVTGGTLGDFTHAFSSSSVKGPAGPTVSTPEPATLALALCGAGALLLAGCGGDHGRPAPATTQISPEREQGPRLARAPGSYPGSGTDPEERRWASRAESRSAIVHSFSHAPYNGFFSASELSGILKKVGAQLLRALGNNLGLKAAANALNRLLIRFAGPHAWGLLIADMCYCAYCCL
jgi:hypothetical protein